MVYIFTTYEKIIRIKNQTVSDNYKTVLNKNVVSGNKNVFNILNMCYKIQPHYHLI